MLSNPIVAEPPAQFHEVKSIRLVDTTSDKWADIRNKSEAVISVIYSLLESGKSVSISCSFGKDSLTVLVLALEALKRAVADNVKIKGFYVTHSDTLIENPALGFYCLRMVEDLREYAVKEGFPLEVVVSQPDLTSSFVYTTIGRGRLPVFPNKKSRICSIDWKVRPQQKALKEILKKAGGSANHVSLIGTRFAESSARAEKMNERNESSTEPQIDGEGYLYLSPIAEWSVEDVWTLLISVDESRGSSTYKTFVSNFEWTLRLYKDANEGTCAIIVGENGNKAACGSRFGCVFCTQIKEDKSLNAMVESDCGSYKHLAGLSKIRDYLVDTQFDLSKRTVYGQSISEAGYINCRPDNYNVGMRKELLRYLITLDVEEERRAEDHFEEYASGSIEKTAENERLCEVQFKFVTPQMLMAVEFAWAVQSVSPEGFSANRIFYEIDTLGKRYYPPELSEREIKVDAIPSKRWLYVGDFETLNGMSGLRNPIMESLEGADGYQEINTMAGVSRICRTESDLKMSVDAAEALWFVTFDFESLYFQFQHIHSDDAVKYLLHKGMIKLPNSKLSTYHMMAKRYQLLRDRMLIYNSGEEIGSLETISDAEHSELIKNHQ